MLWKESYPPLEPPARLPFRTWPFTRCSPYLRGDGQAHCRPPGRLFFPGGGRSARIAELCVWHRATSSRWPSQEPDRRAWRPRWAISPARARKSPFCLTAISAFEWRIWPGGKARKWYALEIPWGQTVSDEQANEFIRKEKPQIVFYVQAETSTGAYQRGKAIAQAAHEVDALVIADCVTSLGGMPVEVDANLIDVAYSGTRRRWPARRAWRPSPSHRGRSNAAGTHADHPLMVPRSEAARRVHAVGPPLPPHGAHHAVLRVARSPGDDCRGRPRRTLGASPPESTKRLSPALKPWGIQCSSRRNIACGRSTHREFQKALTTPSCAAT